MIRVLITDDEYFVRRGLVHMIPWEENGFVVVGEAANGEKALEFMKEKDVDLLLTDLTMPVMSGFDLIRKAKEQYPALLIAVLTCHQDFHHIQDALRMGAIDYIVKTELENDNLNAWVSRLAGRVQEEQRRHGAVLPEESTQTRGRWSLFLIAASRSLAAEWPEGVKRDGEGHVVQIPGYGWLISQEASGRGAQTPETLGVDLDLSCWVPVIIENGKQVPDKTAVQILSHYVATEFFYSYRSGAGKYNIDWSTLEMAFKDRQTELEGLLRQWKSFLWVYQDDLFREWGQQVRKLMPSSGEWFPYLLRTFRNWSHLVSFDRSREWAARAADLQFWEQWVDFLQQVRTQLRRGDLSEEVCISVLRAIEIASRELHMGVNQADIAKRVNLNRSYFSHCFKQFAGKPFHDMVNDLRIDRATELLETTSHPIYWVAEQVGFHDEKYFSKLYKQQTGRLPSELRNS